MSDPRPGPLVDPGAPLTPAQMQRYSRHLLLPGIGVDGQRRLRNARVLVVGAGGLGSPALLYLAAAGVGTLGVIDDDVVEASNLQRQVIHRVADIGRPKVDSAAAAIARLDPDIRVRTHRERLDVDNALDLLGGYDLVLDGSDNFATRYLVADATEIVGMPCVWGSILRFDGQVSVFWPGVGPVYRDVFPDPPDPRLVPSCAEAGVFGVLCAAIGAAMGAEAIKLITGTGRALVGRFLVHDALAATWREIAVRPDPARAPVTELAEVDAPYCPVPASAPEHTLEPGELAHLLARRGAGDADFDLLDVREPLEWQVHHIQGARLVPQDQILTGAVAFPRQRPLILYCAVGVRSQQVLEHLLAVGHADVRHLRGGIGAWDRSSAAQMGAASPAPGT